MAEIIFGIDHGNGNMKGESVCFPCGLVRYVSEPGRFMNEDILEYQGTYYTLSDTKMPFKADKTVDDDYFILTLYALTMEARNKGITLTGKDVVLGIGLPPADYGQQATPFKKYFLDHAKHGITFKMNGKNVSFYLKDVFVSPQNFAAVMCFKASLLKKYRTVNCIDIGDGTVDLLVIRNGKPDLVVKITNCYVWEVATSNDWIGYYGSIAGGVLTLAGVYITIKNGEKTRKEDLRNSIMPILYIEIDNTGNVCVTENGEFAGDEFQYDKVEKRKSVCFRITLHNIGMKAAKNLKIGVVDKNGEWQDLGNNLLLQVGDKHVFPLGVQLYDLNYYENERIERTIVFRVKFQDLIGENYVQDIEVDLKPQDGEGDWYYYCENENALEAEYVGSR